MANIYLDSNWFFDIISRNKQKATQLDNHTPHVSPLSCHIYCYVEKIKIPSKNFSKAVSNLVVVELSQKILERALEGPTSDLEDNIQLHSAAESECIYFLTNNKNLLNLKYFGKCKIVNKLG